MLSVRRRRRAARRGGAVVKTSAPRNPATASSRAGPSAPTLTSGGRRLASETPSKRSDSITTDRPGADRRRAVKATAPSPPARVRVARARVLLSRPVSSSRLLGRGSPCLRTLVLTILSHPSRNFQSLLKPNRPVVHGCQSLCRAGCWNAGFFGLCRPRPESLASTSRASPGSRQPQKTQPLAPPTPRSQRLATRLSGPKDAGRKRARAALGHETSSDHGHPSIGPLHRHEGAARVAASANERGDPRKHLFG